MSSPLITVFGATGAQGGPVVAELLAAGFRVRAVARQVAALQQRFGDRVEAVAADLGQVEQVRAALAGADGAFAHMPIPTAPDAADRQFDALLEAATAIALPQLVFSTSGYADARFRQTAMIAANAALSHAVLASSLPALVLQPTLYLENLLFPPLAPRLFTEGVLDYPPVPVNRRLSWTSQSDQARFAVAAFRQPALNGHAYEIASGPAVTGPEIAELLSVWLGRPVRFEPQTPQAFGEHLGRVFGSPHAGQAIAEMYAAIEELPPEGAVVDTETLSRSFGVQLPTLAEHIAAWPKP